MGKTTKARIYIKDKVQEVGYRPFILQKILESDLEGGTAKNLPDGRLMVLLQGRKESIREFIVQLKSEKPELAGNPTISNVEYGVDVHVPPIMRASQGMLLEQSGKGVTIMEDMRNMLGGMNGKLDKLDTMNDKMDSMNNQMDSMNGKLDIMNGKLDTMNNKLDLLFDIKKLLEVIAAKALG